MGKILIISFHYFPDLCAGSFRTTSLVEQLRLCAPSDIEIDVITTSPNRYDSYTAEAEKLEKFPGLCIRRISLIKHHSGMIAQAVAFAYFAKQVSSIVKKENYSLVYATSGRLLVAVLGAWIARSKKAVLYLDIRDIFVETIGDVFSGILSKISKFWFSIIEKWTFTRAQRINLVSKGFESYFIQRYPKAQYSWFTNGIDPEFISLSETKVIKLNKEIVVLYAGNIGEGQGLHRIIPELAERMHGIIRFKLIGDGGRLTQLENEIKVNGYQTVELLPPMNRTELIKEYQKADVLFLHLNDYDAFRRVLPSKLFEYAALGKPIWAGVSGYAAEFIMTEITNAVVFEPCNVLQAIEVFNQLKIEKQDRHAFIEKYQRTHIMKAMALDMLSLL